MRYVLLMTLSGNMLFMGFLCWKSVFGKFVTQNMKYRALMVTMLVYMVPWVWLKGVYGRILGLFWHERAITDKKSMVNMADIRTNEAIYRTEEYRVLMLMIGIWFVVAVSLVTFKSAKHIQRCRALRELAIPCPDERLEETIDRLRKELRYRRSLTVVWTRADNETITLGIWKPVVYLQKEYTENELYLILKHEMIHIVRKDLLIKLLQEFMSCVHWFNPLVHLLVHEMQFVCEASCDERVVEGSGDGREVYANLLDKNKKSKKMKVTVGNGFEDSDKEMVKRIELIRKIRNVSYREKMVSAGFFLLLIFVSSLTALAYPKVQHIKDIVAKTMEDAEDGCNFMFYQWTEDGYDMPVDVFPYGEQFIDREGKSYPVNSGNTDAACTRHDLAQGYYKKHIKIGSDCVVEIYEGIRCRNCGATEIGNLCLTTEQDVCAHGR